MSTTASIELVAIMSHNVNIHVDAIDASSNYTKNVYVVTHGYRIKSEGYIKGDLTN